VERISGLTGEVLGARWDEIDFAERVWTVPAKRMKAGKEHRVPLSDAAMAVIEAMSAIRVDEHVFPGRNGMLGPQAMRRILEGINAEISVHGFRSTFHDWASETTGYPNEDIEMALAHTIKNRSEAAYWRGDLFEKRRALMRDWAQRCAGGAEVVPLRRVRERREGACARNPLPGPSRSIRRIDPGRGRRRACRDRRGVDEPSTRLAPAVDGVVDRVDYYGRLPRLHRLCFQRSR